MPHIVIEYSENLAEKIATTGLLRQVHQAVEKTALFDPKTIKARSIGYAALVLPEGAAGFIHITVSILTGRTVEQRRSLSDAVFTTLKSTLPDGGILSCDIREMSAETYRK